MTSIANIAMDRVRNAIIFLLHFISIFTLCAAGSYYVSTERPVIQYVDKDIVPYLNVTSRRFGRRNPKYYTDIHATVKVEINNNVKYDIYFYEFVHPYYRPTFLEMHFKWCNLFLKDTFIGESLRESLPGKCPHKPGSYHLYNLTLNDDALPPNFPFTKGRLIVNATYKDKPAVSCYSDIELKKKIQKIKA